MRVYFVNNVSIGGVIRFWGIEPYVPFCEFVINIWNKYVVSSMYARFVNRQMRHVKR